MRRKRGKEITEGFPEEVALRLQTQHGQVGWQGEWRMGEHSRPGGPDDAGPCGSCEGVEIHPRRSCSLLVRMKIDRWKSL